MTPADLSIIPADLIRFPVSAGVKVERPAVDVRYDRALNMIALSVDGADDIHFGRDSTFSLMDEIEKALEVQAKLGGVG
ncbi:hypothetical protein [Rhodococcus qingshengii]|uniref:hypothetical protein n=1 Tax=Rhodococcus qingshengii TaxID=334542 RepID=UPI001AE02753|nr:hypothetical protein [Rhodococcus qingshengii]MCQ4150254.1 hypothetical protein [Rhodococcus qingshengii]